MKSVSGILLSVFFSIQSFASYTTLKIECMKQLTKEIIAETENPDPLIPNKFDWVEMGYGEGAKIHVAVLLEQCIGEKITQDINTGAFKICPKENNTKCIYDLVAHNFSTSTGFMQSIENLAIAGTSDAKTSDFEEVSLNLFEDIVNIMEDLDLESLLENKVNIAALSDTEKKVHAVRLAILKYNLRCAYESIERGIPKVKKETISTTRLPAAEIVRRKIKIERGLRLRAKYKKLKNKFVDGKKK